jgi:DUF971 family protein
MIPKKISIKDKRFLFIIWNDGKESMLSLSSLRKNCPCATCRDEREHRALNYIPLISESQTAIKDIKPVGNYAIQLFWQDGHNTGIYTYEKLKNWNNK